MKSIHILITSWGKNQELSDKTHPVGNYSQTILKGVILHQHATKYHEGLQVTSELAILADFTGQRNPERRPSLGKKSTEKFKRFYTGADPASFTYIFSIFQLPEMSLCDSSL